MFRRLDMFKCLLEKERFNKFKEIIYILENVIDEAEFKVTPKGLTLEAMDESKILFVDLLLKRKLFK